MNRRAFLTAVAAIPFVGRVVPASALQRQPVALRMAAAIILPGIYGFREDGNGAFDVDVQADFTEDRLLVKMCNMPRPTRLVTGVITRADIDSAAYRAKFHPMLLLMKAMLFASDGPNMHMILNLSEVV